MIIDLNTARRQDELEAARRQVDADDIKRRLHANPRAFVEWLFSGRAVIGKHEARVADVTGAAGESLAVRLTGPDAGLWHDFATGEGGDLVGLYMANMGYGRGSFQLALKELAKEFLGDAIEVQRAPFQPSAADRIAEKKAKLGDKPREENQLLGAPVESYGYYGRDGKVMAVIRRYEPGGIDEETGKPEKTFRASPGFPTPRPLYRIPEIIQATHVVFTEGERKANALVSVGIKATTAMGGANTKVEMVDWSVLAGKHVTLWPDKDKAGYDYAQKVAPILTGLGCRVDVVEPPADKPAKWDAHDCILEGGDPHSLIGAAAPFMRNTTQSRIRLLDIDELENLEPPEWLIDQALTKNGLSVLWGRSGSMKSFVALDMALCIATGSEWHGRAVTAGPSVYVAAEGSHGLSRRIVGWRRTRGRDLAKPQFFLVPHSLALTTDDLAELVNAILALPVRPVLIILDTLARTIGMLDENKTPDMNAYVNAADRLRTDTGAHVMIVHHSGVHEDRRERGSGALRAAADTVIKVERKGQTDINLINQAPEGKQKDAEEFQTIKLRTAKTAFTINETEQTTLVLNLRETDSEEADAGNQREAVRFGKNERLVVQAITKANGLPLGFTRLKLITGMNNGSLSRALDSLEDKNVILELSGGIEGEKRWKLV